MLNSTLCYIEKDEKYLMLHRVKKENDVNRDKWVGVGGKFEDGESPELATARALVERQYAAKLAAGKRDQVAAALARRGFSHAVIREVLDNDSF